MPARDSSSPATQADIIRLEARIDRCATKDDLKNFATKDDLKNFATKDDLKKELARFVTKDDLKKELARFVTKDDLRSELARFVTKDDLRSELARFATRDELKSELTRFATREALDNLAAATKIGFDEVIGRIDRLEARMDGMEVRMQEMEGRLTATLARAVDAATERYLDYLRAANDETRAVAGRVQGLERRVEEHIADTSVHRQRRGSRR